MPSPHTTNRPDKPTANQLRYLRQLANRAGQTFTYPTTKHQASAEIRRLKKLAEDSRLEREVERDRLQREVELPADAAAYREDEVTGHGAGAHWTHHPDERPAPTAGAERKLASYELPDGTERALFAQRIRGRVAISDRPTSGHGRVYLVERHVHSQDEMDALIAHYIADSVDRGEPAVLVPTNPELGR
ncbi:hypothetical protein OM076_22865 [Solirubrobacter ginsenosidimutans]|uniref:Uncharacterized protein n=1 Tax=Solirubrobacter ginsenosidimutans TaxID=490573 RepID=A0A9X3MV14_9ACTN|nr:hypothetical protein [Solirubrobacter ginsenosidimutans]MDA0163134.1 hypothetical protein [Solirubrobacter ginsenosidimutans]